VIYLDDLTPSDVKILKAGRLIGDKKGGRAAALGIYVAAIGYCRNHLTDGLVPVDFLLDFSKNANAVDALVEVELLEKRGDDYFVHAFLKWNKSRSEVLQERADTAERMRRFRRRVKPKGGPGDGGVTPSLMRDEHRHDPVRDAGVTQPHDPRSTYHDPLRTPEVVPGTSRPADSIEEQKQPAGETAAAPPPLDSPIFDKPRTPQRHLRLATDTSGDNYRVLSKLAREAITDGTTYAELPREVEDRARKAHVIFARDTVLRACESEWFKHEHPEVVGGQR